MNNHNLVIYEFDELYKILVEIKKDINLSFEKANKQKLSDLNSKTNYFVFTKKEIPGLNNQIVFNDFPIPIFKLLEKKLVYKNRIDTSGSVSAIIDNRIHFKGSWALDSIYENKLEFKSKDFGIKCHRIFSKPHDLETKIFYHNEKEFKEIRVNADDHFLKMLEAFVTNKNIVWTNADTIRTIDLMDKLRLK